MPLLLICTSIIYADRRKPYKIPFRFVVDAPVRIAIVNPYRFGYLSKHCIVSILSYYTHRKFLTFVVMTLLAMSPQYRFRRLFSVFILMLFPSRICVFRCFTNVFSFLSRVFTSQTSYYVVHPVFVAQSLLLCFTNEAQCPATFP